MVRSSRRNWHWVRRRRTCYPDPATFRPPAVQAGRDHATQRQPKELEPPSAASRRETRSESMSRASSKRQRLHLFRRGNDRCPICLTPFIEAEVEQGQTVTLEHVPARAFRAGGTAMCLTCRPCNLNTSRAEHAAVEAQRDEQKVQLRIPGLPTQTAYVSKGEGATFHLRMTKTRVPRTVLLRSGAALSGVRFDGEPAVGALRQRALAEGRVPVGGLAAGPPRATATPRAPPLNRSGSRSCSRGRRSFATASFHSLPAGR